MGIAEPLIVGTTRGRADERFAWQVDEMEPVFVANSGDGIQPEATLYRVKVSVAWRGEGGDRAISLRGLRLTGRQ